MDHRRIQHGEKVNDNIDIFVVFSSVLQNQILLYSMSPGTMLPIYSIQIVSTVMTFLSYATHETEEESFRANKIRCLSK